MAVAVRPVRSIDPFFFCAADESPCRDGTFAIISSERREVSLPETCQNATAPHLNRVSLCNRCGNQLQQGLVSADCAVRDQGCAPVESPLPRPVRTCGKPAK
ncbi:hypothetical protein RHEC894_CH04217 [Rhizobium sp. CIAT894]|nr:hypothetical protein RHEC894_CH04217 [Rhizobium sp. CIAT894]